MNTIHSDTTNILYIVGLTPVGFVYLPVVEEENPEFWRSQARNTLQSALDRKLNTNVARNILLFLGDGELHNTVILTY